MCLKDWGDPGKAEHSVKNEQHFLRAALPGSLAQWWLEPVPKALLKGVEWLA